ncbi:MAG: gliding motility protein GldL [Bacteroides sp.]|nr:gliding motility protein GldL [Bacteroides sp.]
MDKSSLKERYRTLTTWEGGQRLFNFAYSVGAAIVILGALFKILHLPGGNTLLCIGMGTEVLMFILTAFDRPPKEYHWEEVFPELDSVRGRAAEVEEGETPAAITHTRTVGGQVETVAGNVSGAAAGGAVAVAPSPAAQETFNSAEMTEATRNYVEQMNSITEQLAQLRETTRNLNAVSELLLQSYQAVTDNSSAVTENSRDYVSRMADLNRNIGGLNTIYEIQLKSVSSQLESIDRVNRGIKDIRDMYEKSASQSARYCEETEKLARSMQQLNQVYEKMLSAMTVNMYRPMVSDIPGAQSSGSL